MVAILRPPKRFSRIAGVFQQKDSITQFQEKGSITHYIDRIRYVNKAGCAICTDIYSKSDAISHEKIKKLGFKFEYPDTRVGLIEMFDWIKEENYEPMKLFA